MLSLAKTRATALKVRVVARGGVYFINPQQTHQGSRRSIGPPIADLRRWGSCWGHARRSPTMPKVSSWVYGSPLS